MNGKIKIIFILLLIPIGMTSCNLYNKYLQSGNIQRDVWSYYYNDSLDISVKLAGDHVLVGDKRKINQLLRKYKLKKLKGNLIDLFETKILPYYKVFLFSFKDLKALKTFLNKKNYHKIRYYNDSTKIEILDSVDYVYGKAKSNTANNYVLFLCFSKDQKYPYDIMLAEYKKSLNNIYFNKGYRNILPKPFQLGFEKSKNEDGSFNYLQPVSALKNYAGYYGKNNFIFLQAICTYSSMISNSKVFNHYFNLYNNKSLHIYSDDTIATDYRAIRKILDISMKNRLLLFNENHFNNKHRKLIKFLLKGLKKNGYQYLGLEALSYESNIMKRGFLIRKDGFYTNNPSMANLIRTAIRLNFKVFGYDSIRGNRELNQAKIIYNKTFKKNKNAKVIILGGGDHILKTPDKSGKKWMAYYLDSISGITPVTLSQTLLFCHQKHWLKLCRGDIQNYKRVDYLIGNNFPDSICHKSKPYTIHFDFKKSNYTYKYLLSIYIKEEFKKGKNAVPVKNFLITNKMSSLKMYLFPNKYLYVIKNKHNEVIKKGLIK